MSFEWFLDVYNEINYPKKAIDIDIKIKWQIDVIFNKYQYNYEKFILEVSKVLDISKQDQIKYLKKIQYCIHCDQDYPITQDPFIIFKNTLNDDITYKLCTNCITFSCQKCKYKPCGPWETFYITDNKIFICEKCK